MHHIELNGWESNVRFSASHFIPEHDKCARLHGHDYAVHFKAFGKLNDKGILMDFTALKKTLRELVDHLDHRMVIPLKSASIAVQTDDEKGQVSVWTKGGKTYSFPLEDVVLLDLGASSVEELAGYFMQRLLASGAIPANVEEVEVGVDEGKGQGARLRRKLR